MNEMKFVDMDDYDIEQEETMSRYLVEVVIGYKNGMWATKTVEVNAPHPELMDEGIVEKQVLKKAVKEIEEDLNCGDRVSFYHLISTS